MATPFEGHPANHPFPAAGPNASSTREAASDPDSLLTSAQRRVLERLWREHRDRSAWSESLPVLLLDRCWLRLTVVTVAALPSRLPPDASGEAPELARYQELRRDGLGSWEAQQRCWEEFGTEACRQAQVRFWRAQERGNRGWTLERYLALRSEYRFRWESPRPRALPMLVLARSGLSTSGNDGEDHRLLWLCPGADGNGGTMRHTCA